MSVPLELIAYYQSGKALAGEIAVEPWFCEFWPFGELDTHNSSYQVSEYAPGYFGFATSGGGEMFALSPNGAVVCLAFVGMSPKEELLVAESWGVFVGMLSKA